MRLSTSLFYQRAQDSLTTSQSRLDKVQLQLTKQTRILSPADDPIGNSQVLALDEKLAQNAQFDRNSVTLENNLRREESVLSNMVDYVQRARTLAVQAGNGSLSAENREAVALELRNIEQALFDFTNAQDEAGEYIFAGYQNRIQPMEYDNASESYSYRSDDGQRKIQLSPSLYLPAGDPGSKVFNGLSKRVDIDFTAGDNLVKSLKAADREALANYWDAGDPDTQSASIQFGAGTYDVLDGGGNVVQAAVPYNPGDTITYNGVEIETTNDVANGDVIDFDIGEPVSRNLVTQVADLANALENSGPEDKGFFREEIASSLDSFDDAISSLTDTQAKVGARLNVLESSKLSNADIEIINKKARSDIADVDYSTAVTDLIKNETIYSAAQQVFSRVSRLSLFDYI
ncbi:MAG TPA: flagellar hook-associated protein 3 [Idiomarina abyssalis]|jgi:flagellar hook-associated protein 3 FlgL|uniref:flagellar hook-associated protein FlgL n=1 Tax=Idiomarina TaxID=135575 RepID=UPI000C0D19F4|nr:MULTISPECIES: flagellar hook-associated protein FlgL [Idiomarina]MBQ20541.1 flagellar hook-associated protein 3 [Flavobacteriales bacterium]MAB22263.1 flagellar hook-associated protein 3 [Idiomarina sp.]MBH94428.1 flagellar hook-associated protein 3 [Idiomarina sp.]MDA6066575.1 flagellar hook-associated protein FlgL [Idiomarina abyssalis]QZN91567.1 flagellar hook-associated protein FlgL [Idiomarina abyssalis]|tara:strand:- start:14907 stop:16115 length:1209 start_codon:yes stop_codon:yes gene_type:complete